MTYLLVALDQLQAEGDLWMVLILLEADPYPNLAPVPYPVGGQIASWGLSACRWT